MLDEILFSAFSKNERIREVVLGELTRLKSRGYIADDPQELAADLFGRLEERAGQARDVVSPLLKGVGATLREAFDVPSRAEILALTEALERQAARSAAESTESTESS